MATDDERQEVARRLRETGEKLGRSTLLWYHIAKSLGVRTATDGKTACGMLADLIEPSRDRYTPQKAAEEMFGKMRHSTKEEADAYDAMLKSKSVEIHPVDRDALLALADKMSRYASLRKSHGMDVDTMAAMAWVHRIREALGVES